MTAKKISNKFEGQRIMDLNLSACFFCSLLVETACEEMNLGLDI
jgi:hypothetical protein